MPNDQLRIAKRLTANRQLQAELRDLLVVLNEQVSFLTDVESRTRARAAVANNHVAQREHRLAKDDLDRAARERDDVARQLSEAASNQDRLLDQMLNQR